MTDPLLHRSRRLRLRRGSAPTSLHAANLAADAQAEAGVHMVAPRSMMDGQVPAMRHTLDQSGHPHTPSLAYAAEYGSAFYTPIRSAIASALPGDCTTHQQSSAPGRSTRRWTKSSSTYNKAPIRPWPPQPYLDMIQALRASVDMPLAAYQTSREHAMVNTAAGHSWIDCERDIRESLLAIRRAGTTFTNTDWATETVRWSEA